MSSLLARRNVIVVASIPVSMVSGKNGILRTWSFVLASGKSLAESDCFRLVEIQYERNDIQFERGHFRVRGDTVEVRPAELENAVANSLVMKSIRSPVLIR